MRPLRELTLILLVLAGAILASQVPRFVQEYEQRLGGALQVAQANVERDEGLARARNLAIADYLRQLEAEGPLAREQADGIRARALQYAELRRQAEELAGSSRLVRPVVLARAHDPDLLRATWEKYEVTLTFDLAFGAIGLLVGWLINSILWLPFGYRHRAFGIRQ